MSTIIRLYLLTKVLGVCFLIVFQKIPIHILQNRYFSYFCSPKMEGIAQLVRATVCGTVGRGFETHYSPKLNKPCKLYLFTRFFIKTSL